MRVVVMTVWVGRIGCIAGRGDWNWGSDATGGCYLRYAEKRITYHTLCDNLLQDSFWRWDSCSVSCALYKMTCPKTKSIQYYSLFPNFFCKIATHLVSQRRTWWLQRPGMIHLRLPTVTYHENSPINLLYISRSQWRFYSEGNDIVQYTVACK